MKIFFHGHSDGGFFCRQIQNLYKSKRLKLDTLSILPLPEKPNTSQDEYYLIVIPALNFSTNRWRDESNPILELHKYCKSDLKENKAHLIIDYSNESGTESQLANIKRWLNEASITDHKKCTFLAQNRLLKSDAHLDVKFFDAFILSVGLTCERMLSNQSIYNRIKNSIVDTHKRPPKILCLNATPRAHRLHACAALVKAGLDSKSLISFPNFDYAKNVGLNPTNEVLRIANTPYAQYAESIEKFILNLPYRIDAFEETGNHLAQKIDIESYTQTSISFVTETGVSNAVWRVTEKSLKAIAFGHMTVIFGHPNSLHFLRIFGFNTFDDLIDNSYDSLTHPYDRLRESINELSAIVRNFESYDNTDILMKYSQAALFNVDWMKNDFINHYIDQFLSPLLSHFEAPSHPENISSS